MKIRSIKKTISVCVLLLLFAANAFGQTDAKTAKNDEKKQHKIDKTKVPKVVTDVWISEYPVSTYENWYGYPTYNDYESNWFYDWYDQEPYVYSEYPEYYSVDFTKENIPHKAVYSKGGKKIAVHKKVTDLPKAVSSAISAGAYKTWTVGKDKEEIFKDKDSDQLKVYKVAVENGKEKHSLYFQPDGKLLKDKNCVK